MTTATTTAAATTATPALTTFESLRASGLDSRRWTSGRSRTLRTPLLTLGRTLRTSLLAPGGRSGRRSSRPAGRSGRRSSRPAGRSDPRLAAPGGRSDRGSPRPTGRSGAGSPRRRSSPRRAADRAAPRPPGPLHPGVLRPLHAHGRGGHAPTRARRGHRRPREGRPRGVASSAPVGPRSDAEEPARTFFEDVIITSARKGPALPGPSSPPRPASCLRKRRPCGPSVTSVLRIASGRQGEPWNACPRAASEP